MTDEVLLHGVFNLLPVLISLIVTHGIFQIPLAEGDEVLLHGIFNFLPVLISPTITEKSEAM